jgi:hypothetical protein
MKPFRLPHSKIDFFKLIANTFSDNLSDFKPKLRGLKLYSALSIALGYKDFKELQRDSKLYGDSFFDWDAFTINIFQNLHEALFIPQQKIVMAFLLSCQSLDDEIIPAEWKSPHFSPRIGSKARIDSDACIKFMELVRSVRQKNDSLVNAYIEEKIQAEVSCQLADTIEKFGGN